MTDRELSALVATDVMGWTGWYVVNGDALVKRVRTGIPSALDYWADSLGKRYPCGWSPSTDIAAAWEVVERMRHDGWTWFGLEVGVDGEWEAAFDKRECSALLAEWNESAPRAICLAALAAKRGDV